VAPASRVVTLSFMKTKKITKKQLIAENAALRAQLEQPQPRLVVCEANPDFPDLDLIGFGMPFSWGPPDFERECFDPDCG
jgi:hypothetical protein